MKKYSITEEIPDDLNVCEVFHNNDHAKIILKLIPIKEEADKICSEKLTLSNPSSQGEAGILTERIPPFEIAAMPGIRERSTAAYFNEHKKKELIESESYPTKSFYGNIIVPTSKKNEISFTCKLMETPESQESSLKESALEYEVKQNEKQKRKNVLKAFTSMFSESHSISRKTSCYKKSLKIIEQISLCDNILSK